MTAETSPVATTGFRVPTANCSSAPVSRGHDGTTGMRVRHLCSATDIVHCSAVGIQPPGTSPITMADWQLGARMPKCHSKSCRQVNSTMFPGCLTSALCAIETRLILQALPVPVNRFGKCRMHTPVAQLPVLLRASTLSQLAGTIPCPRYGRSRTLPGLVRIEVGGSIALISRSILTTCRVAAARTFGAFPG